MHIDNTIIKNLDLLGQVSDRYKAKDECTNLEGPSWNKIFNNELKNPKSDDEKEASKENILGNITWMAINQISSFKNFSQGDADNIKILLFNLVGSIINTIDNSSGLPKRVVVEPRLTVETLYKNFIETATETLKQCRNNPNQTIQQKLYICAGDTTNCFEMNLSDQNITLSACSIYNGITNALNKTISKSGQSPYTPSEKFWVSLLTPTLYSLIVDARKSATPDMIEDIAEKETKRINAYLFEGLLTNLIDILNKSFAARGLKKFPEQDVNLIIDRAKMVLKEYEDKVKPYKTDGYDAIRIVNDYRQFFQNATKGKINEDVKIRKGN